MTYPTTSDINGALRSFAEKKLAGRGQEPNTALLAEQTKGVERLISLIRSQQSVLFYGATGVGKTIQTLVALSFHAAHYKSRVLVLAPNASVRDERWEADLELLLDAIEDNAALAKSPRWAKLLKNLLTVNIDEAVRPSRLHNQPEIWLGTTPSLSSVTDGTGRGSLSHRRLWLQALDPSLVVIDEAHVRTREGTRTRDVLIELLADRKLVALTATPVSQRADGLQQVVALNGHGDWAEPITKYQERVHAAVRTWWTTAGDVDRTDQAVRSAINKKSDARLAFKTNIVRQQPAENNQILPKRIEVSVGEPWLRGYGLARILPALLSGDEKGDGSRNHSGVKPSDSYRRMLLSSPAAFWSSNVAVVLTSKRKAAWSELSREMESLIGPGLNGEDGRGQLEHPKVRWTVEHALEESQRRQVLIFVQYLKSADAIRAAIEAESERCGLDTWVGLAKEQVDVTRFREGSMGGVLVASPKHSMGLEFDQIHRGSERERLLICHDLPWSAVALQQQQGRLRRAANGFPTIAIWAPILKLPDDKRVWNTVMGRWSVSEIIDVEGGFAGDSIEVDGPGNFPDAFIGRLKLQ